MSTIYKKSQLTNNGEEWLKLGNYSLYKVSSNFILESNTGKVLGKYNDLAGGISALMKVRKGKESE